MKMGLACNVDKELTKAREKWPGAVALQSYDRIGLFLNLPVDSAFCNF